MISRILGQINMKWESRTSDRPVPILTNLLNKHFEDLIRQLVQQDQDKAFNADIEMIIKKLPVELRKNLAEHLWQYYSEDNSQTRERLIIIADQLASREGDQDKSYSRVAERINRKILGQKEAKELPGKKFQSYAEKVQALLTEYQRVGTQKTAAKFSEEFDELGNQGKILVGLYPETVEQFLPLIKMLRREVETINFHLRKDPAPAPHGWSMQETIQDLFEVVEDVRKKHLPAVTLLEEILGKACKGKKGWDQDIEKYMLSSGDKIVQSGEALKVIKEIIRVLPKVKSSSALSSYMEDILLPACQRASDKNPVEMLRVAQELHTYFTNAEKKDVVSQGFKLDKPFDYNYKKNQNLDFIVRMLNKKTSYKEKIIKEIGEIFSKDKKFAREIVVFFKTSSELLVEHSPLTKYLGKLLVQPVHSVVSGESVDVFNDYQIKMKEFFKNYSIQDHEVFIFSLEVLAREGENILKKDPTQADNFLKLAQFIQEKAKKIDKQYRNRKASEYHEPETDKKDEEILSFSGDAGTIVRNFRLNIHPLIVLQETLKKIEQSNWEGDLEEMVKSAVKKREEAAAVDMIIKKITSSKSWMKENLRLYLFKQLDSVVATYFDDSPFDLLLNKERVLVLFKVANAKVEFSDIQLQQSAIKNYEMIVELSDDNNQKAEALFKKAELIDKAELNTRVALYDKAFKLSTDLTLQMQALENLYQINPGKREEYLDRFIDHMKGMGYDSPEGQVARQTFMLLQDKEFRHAVAERMMARFNDLEGENRLDVPALLQEKDNFLIKFLGTPTSVLGLGKRVGIETKSMQILKEATLEKLLINMNDKTWQERKDENLWTEVLVSLVSQEKAQDAAEKIIHKIDHTKDPDKRSALFMYLDGILSNMSSHPENARTGNYAAVAFQIAKAKEKWLDYGGGTVDEYYKIARDTSGPNLVIFLKAAKNLYSYYKDAKLTLDGKANLDEVINVLQDEDYDAHDPMINQMLSILIKDDAFRQALASRIVQRCRDRDDYMSINMFQDNDNNLLVKFFSNEPIIKQERLYDKDPLQRLHAILKIIGRDPSWQDQLDEIYAEELFKENQGDLAVKEILKKLDAPIPNADKLFLIGFLEEQLDDSIDDKMQQQLFLKKIEVSAVDDIIDDCRRKLDYLTDLGFKIKILEQIYRLDPGKAQDYVDNFIDLTKDVVYQDAAGQMPLLKNREFRHAIAKRMMARFNSNGSDALDVSMLLQKEKNFLVKFLDTSTSALGLGKKFGIETKSVEILQDATLEKLLINMNDKQWKDGKDAMLWKNVLRSLVLQGKAQDAAGKIIHKLDHIKDPAKRKVLLNHLDEIMENCRGNNKDYAAVAFAIAKVRERGSEEKVDEYYKIARDNSSANLVLFLQAAKNLFLRCLLHEAENQHLDSVIDILKEKKYDANDPATKQTLNILKQDYFGMALAGRIVRRCEDPKDPLDFNVFQEPEGLVVLFGSDRYVKKAINRHNEDPIKKDPSVLISQTNKSQGQKFTVRLDKSGMFSKRQRSNSVSSKIDKHSVHEKTRSRDGDADLYTRKKSNSLRKSSS